MNPPSPSPLVPQGAIPPKNTSRSQRVLVIAVMVVLLHVGGLGLVLLQGCQKDANKTTASNSGGSADTNTPAMSYPTPDTNTPSMFASATNTANTALGARPGTNATVPNTMIGGGMPGLPTNVAGGTAPSDIPPLPGTGVTPTGTGVETDYKIQKGDTLSSIATRNKVTLGALLKANPALDPKKLKVGQAIKVPAPAPTATASATPGTGSVPPTGATSEAGATSASLYTVKPGDTLTKIAKTHGITVNQLRAANGMKTTQVQVGKKLKIPAPQKTAAAATNTTRH